MIVALFDAHIRLLRLFMESCWMHPLSGTKAQFGLELANVKCCKTIATLLL